MYDWSGQSNTSHLGTATTFAPPNLVGGTVLGGTVSGQIIQPISGNLPPVSGTLYFANNKPLFGSASIDVLVGAALADGAWPALGSTSVQVTCKADWSSQYAPGDTAILTATSFDSTQTPPTALLTATKTITPGLNNTQPLPSTIVATVTYNSDGTFTLTVPSGP